VETNGKFQVLQKVWLGDNEHEPVSNDVAEGIFEPSEGQVKFKIVPDEYSSMNGTISDDGVLKASSGNTIDGDPMTFDMIALD
jgi:hypothetical protein